MSYLKKLEKDYNDGHITHSDLEDGRKVFNSYSDSLKNMLDKRYTNYEVSDYEGELKPYSKKRNFLYNMTFWNLIRFIFWPYMIGKIFGLQFQY